MQIEEYSNIDRRYNFYWWHIGRKKILECILKKYCHVDSRILDFGCGPGGNIDLLKKFGKVWGVDFSLEALNFAKNKPFEELRRNEPENIPFKDSEFDLVTAFDVLEHTENDLAIIKEINRVLKDDGFILLTVPAHTWLWSGHDMAMEHKRRYSKKDLLEKLKKGGFVIKKQTHFVFPGIFYIFYCKILKTKPKKGETLDITLPKFLNRILILWLVLEAKIIKMISIPFGTSFVVLAQKNMAGQKAPKWPKFPPVLSEEQKRIKDDFMKYWHEVLPKKYVMIEKFNHSFPIKNCSPGGRTLEIGAGLGEHIFYEDLSRTEYFAIEIRPEMAQIIKQRFPSVKVIIGDCQERIDFSDNFFDRVLAIHVLEHLPNLPATLRELKRILKPGGKFCVLIPCEGGLAYGLARRISTKRIFEKRYGIPHQADIITEHINLPAEIIEELSRDFKILKKIYWPLKIQAVNCNLVIGLILEPIK